MKTLIIFVTIFCLHQELSYGQIDAPRISRMYKFMDSLNYDRFLKNPQFRVTELEGIRVGRLSRLEPLYSSIKTDRVVRYPSLLLNGNAYTQSVELENIGTIDLVIDKIELSKGSNFYLSDRMSGVNVPPFGKAVLHIAFQPQQEGESIDTMKIYSNAANVYPMCIVLKGYGIAQDKSLSMDAQSGDQGKLRAVASLDDEFLPKDLSLDQNYPNPFDASTTIKFGLAEEGKVKIVVYNVLGQRVRELLSESRSAGYHLVSWDGHNDHRQSVDSGVYLYVLETSLGVRSMKMLFVK